MSKEQEAELIVPLCFASPVGSRGRHLNLTIGGNLLIRPQHCVVGRPALVVEGRNWSQTYFLHAGSLWRKAVLQRDVFPTKYGMTLSSEALGIPFLQPEFADFDFTRPTAEASRIPGWREEVERIERKLADDVAACDEDFYIRCAPSILVRWPRQTTSKPTIGFAVNGAVEDQETTCFSVTRLTAAERFVALNREVPGRSPVRIEIVQALDLADDVHAFATGTRAWLTAKLNDPDPSTALLRHGYGLLPTEVLEDLEVVRDPDIADAARIMEAIGRIRAVLSDDGIVRMGDALATAGADGEAIGRVRHLGRRIARMTRLAVRRWEFECSQSQLAPEDADALAALVNPAGRHPHTFVVPRAGAEL